MILEPAIESILEQRYYQPEENWKGLCRRVADDLGANKRQKDEFFEAMYHGWLLPNSPTLMNAGTGAGNYSACYVLPMVDDMESIMKTASDTVMIHKHGGGTGFDFSRIRPQNSPVKGTLQTASGPVSFMKMINDITEQVKQGGRRRGANMGILRIDHPDIVKFIRCKHDETFLVNFNISVAMTKEFLDAVKWNPTDLWKCEFQGEKFYLDGKGKYYSMEDTLSFEDPPLTAKDLWDIIVESAWKSGDPGIVFIDRINDGNPIRYIDNDDYSIRATNPCGEQPLADYGSCNLVAINLSRIVMNSGPNGEAEIDWAWFDERIKTATRLAEQVITHNKYPIVEVERYSLAMRNIGVGLMGFHDMLLKLGIRYDSSEAFELSEKIMKKIYMGAFIESAKSAKKKGCFTGWTYEGYEPLVALEEFSPAVQSMYKEHGIRNCCLTTIAPTGSIGLIAGCSTGIEPHFADKIYRRDATNPDGYWVINPVIKQATDRYGEDVFISAQDLSAEAHVRMQAAAQKYCDSGISKTINLPNDATIQDVENCYFQAIEMKCKGITIYRDGCKTFQVLDVTDEKLSKSISRKVDIPEACPAMRYKVKDPSSGHSLYLIVSEMDGNPVEIFATGPNLGPAQKELWDTVSRQISLGLRYEIPIEDILEQLDKSKSNISGLPALISRILKQHYTNGGVVGEKKQLSLACPECDAKSFVIEGGCGVCKECGFSECS